MTKNRQVELHARLCKIGQTLDLAKDGSLDDTAAVEALQEVFAGVIELSEAILDEGPIACQDMVNDAKSTILHDVAGLIIAFVRRDGETDAEYLLRLAQQAPKTDPKPVEV